MNSIKDHPDSDILARYAESLAGNTADAQAMATDLTQSEKQEVALHLAYCQQCRRQLHALERTQQQLKTTPPYDPSGLGDGQAQQIAAYIDGKLHGRDTDILAEQLKHDKQALKSALHYAAHSQSMSALTADNISKGRHRTQDRQTPSFMHNIKGLFSLLFSWEHKFNLPAPVMLTACMVLSVFGLTMLHQDKDNEWVVAQFQDQPVIHYQEQGAPTGSIGFFAGTGQQTFSGMQIQLQGKTLILRWQELEKNGNYQISISEIHNNNSTIIHQTESDKAQVKFENFKAKPQQHYQWQLSGISAGGKIFHSSGDFAIAHIGQ